MKKDQRKKIIKTIIGMVLGGIAGFLYWKLVGCSSGTCPITSSPLYSSLYGAVMGGFIAFISNGNGGCCCNGNDKGCKF